MCVPRGNNGGDAAFSSQDNTKGDQEHCLGGKDGDDAYARLCDDTEDWDAAKGDSGDGNEAEGKYRRSG